LHDNHPSEWSEWLADEQLESSVSLREHMKDTMNLCIGTSEEKNDPFQETHGQRDHNIPVGQQNPQNEHQCSVRDTSDQTSWFVCSDGLHEQFGCTVGSCEGSFDWVMMQSKKLNDSSVRSSWKKKLMKNLGSQIESEQALAKYQTWLFKQYIK
jgi:hypothetical protein